MRGLPKFDDPNLIAGTDQFGDAGIYRIRDDLLLVQTVDFFPPLVNDPFTFGQIAAANALSDVFAVGGRPITALNIVGFPSKELDLSVLQDILAGGAERVRAAGAVLVGGHTVRDAEVKYGLAVTGIASPEQLMTNGGARPGDLLVLTKRLGTGFITTAAKAERCPDHVLNTAIASMIELNSVGLPAIRSVKAHASTDVTGFGLGGHAVEMADASDVSICIAVSTLRELPGALDMCQLGFKTGASASNRDYLTRMMHIDEDVDPARVELVFDPQTSGGLLIAVEHQDGEALVQQARAAGLDDCTIIGSVVPRQGAALILRA